jgi:hydrogenase expression/formation protein HypC
MTREQEKNMCLAIPMTIVKIDKDYATASANGVETLVNYVMTPDIKLNDKVLVHAGFIIEKLNEDQAREIEETWTEYFELINSSEGKPL